MMKAKDTVMSHEVAENYIKEHYAELMEQTIDKEYYPSRWHREIQAEISFKAGMKEVVDWVEGNVQFLSCSYEEWKAQKKEWGL